MAKRRQDCAKLRERCVINSNLLNLFAWLPEEIYGVRMLESYAGLAGPRIKLCDDMLGMNSPRTSKPCCFTHILEWMSHLDMAQYKSFLSTFPCTTEIEP